MDASGSLSQVVAEADGSGSLGAYYVRVGDELLEVMRPAAGGTWSTKFIHGDGLRSVRTLTDETGTTTDSRGYEAFWTKNVEAGSDPLVYGFAGEPFEGTSHLAYHRARWMDALVGRFEATDPKPASEQVAGKYHTYLYARNSPGTMLDPAGTDSIDSLPSFQEIVAYILGTSPTGASTAPTVRILGSRDVISNGDPRLQQKVGIAVQYLTLSATGDRLLNAVNSGPTIELHFASIADELIFSPDSAHAIDAPDAEAYLTVSPDEVQSIPAVILSFVASDPEGTSITSSLSTSRSQFIGVVQEGKRRILANYICGRAFDNGVITTSEWRAHWIRVRDGGPCFFHFAYDPFTKTISEMSINGPG